MPIPNTITRTLDLAHPQEKVWAALTTLDGITGLVRQSRRRGVRPRPRRADALGADDNGRSRLRSRWSTRCRCSPTPGRSTGPARGDPRRTYVEFALEPTSSGTRLTVTESGFAQLPDEWLETSLPGQHRGLALGARQARGLP